MSGVALTPTHSAALAHAADLRHEADVDRLVRAVRTDRSGTRAGWLAGLGGHVTAWLPRHRVATATTDFAACCA
ncbi:MAG TPA: hypothetical protein VF314_02060 [Actinomycetes bacterium]